jgi:hypothetical protein
MLCLFRVCARAAADATSERQCCHGRWHGWGGEEIPHHLHGILQLCKLTGKSPDVPGEAHEALEMIYTCSTNLSRLPTGKRSRANLARPTTSPLS